MAGNRVSGSDEAVLVCADVLGAFGVRPADVTRHAPRSLASASVERLLRRALERAEDPMVVCRLLVRSSRRGLTLPARYDHATLAGTLTDVFVGIDWRVDLRDTGDGVHVTATDPDGRTRETTITYPETPLGTNNAPAVLDGLSTGILAGTGARFVLLEAGNRWSAALVEDDELERVRDAYGERICPYEEPLLAENDCTAYLNDGQGSPWPAWARPAEPDLSPERGSSTPEPEVSTIELLGGSPTVKRVEGTDESEVIETLGEVRDDRNDRQSVVERRNRRQTDTEGFGTLKGSMTTTRISNDRFGSELRFESEDDRYRALGAALWTGGNVSVEGLLHDEEFLPSIPAVEPEETRIRFNDPFDPSGLQRTKAAAEESGFEWVDAGELQTTRVSVD